MLLLGRHLALEHVVAGLATDTAALARAKAGRPRPPPHLKERADAVREKSTPRGRNAVSAGSALAAREALCAGEALRTRGGLCTEGMLWAEGGCAQERCRTGQRTEAGRRRGPTSSRPRVPVFRPGTPGTRGVPRPDSGRPPPPASGPPGCTPEELRHARRPHATGQHRDRTLQQPGPGTRTHRGTRDTGNSTPGTRTAQQQERDCDDTPRGVHVAAHCPGARAATPAGDNAPAGMTAARPPTAAGTSCHTGRTRGCASRHSHEYARQPYRPAAAPGQAPADSMPRIPEPPAHTQSSGAH